MHKMTLGLEIQMGKCYCESKIYTDISDEKNGSLEEASVL